MKKTRIYILLLSLVAISYGCETYLAKQGENSDFLTTEEVWNDPDKIKSVAHRLYDCTEWFFESRATYNTRQAAGIGKNYVDMVVASGEVICTRAVTGVTHAIPGDWFKLVNLENFANPDFYHSWEDAWEAIYVSNVILANIDNVPESVLPAFDRLQIKGEAFLFRGWAYHEINKRWGAMPYYKIPLLVTDDYSLARPELSDNIKDLVEDLDSAIANLPEVSYLNDPVNMGRLGKAAAMALKSRALTTAASPNFQPDKGSDPEMWKRAAQAAWDVIKLSRTEEKIGLVQAADSIKKYGEIFHTSKGTIEGLWPRYYRPIGPSLFNLSWGWSNMGGYMGFSPSQEIVDRFETEDGYPVNNPKYDAISGYNDQDPYVNRDPRFYNNILYHGSIWSITKDNDTIDMLTSPELGDDRTSPTGNDFGNSKTGYLVSKMQPNKFNQKQYTSVAYLNSPYIRMAEMYLNYAEAVNEYAGPKETLSGADLSAVDALDAIRERVGMSDVLDEFTTSPEIFRERVHNEFYVELCFEYYMWHAQIRWRTAHTFDGYNFHGVKIIEDDSDAVKYPMGLRFERFEIPLDRHFTEKHYRYPLRQRDLQINPNLEQNPKW